MAGKPQENGHSHLIVNNAQTPSSDIGNGAVGHDDHQLLLNGNHPNQYSSDNGAISNLYENEYDHNILRDIFTADRRSSNGNDSTAALNGAKHAKIGKIKSNPQPMQNNNDNDQKYIENGGDGNDAETLSNFMSPLHLQDTDGRNRGNHIMKQQQQQPQPTLTSPLGRRIMQQQQQLQQQQYPNQSHDTTSSSFQSIQSLYHPQHHAEIDYRSPSFPTIAMHQHQFPPPDDDFLRLPHDNNCNTTTTTTTINKINNSNIYNLEELQRRVIQSHLDSEAIHLPHNGSNTSCHDSNNNMDNVMQNISSMMLSLLTSECFARLIERDATLGLGMSLREYDGCIYVQALIQRERSWFKDEEEKEENGYISRSSGGGAAAAAVAGPAAKAGILPGDRIIGLNGRPFLKGRLASDCNDSISNGRSNNHYSTHDNIPTSEEVMSSVRDAISNAESPMVLHIQRLPDRKNMVALLQKLQKEARDVHTEKSVSKRSAIPIITNGTKPMPSPARTTTPSKRSRGPILHKFAMALSNRGIIQKGREEYAVTMQLRLLTDRTRQWESKLSFRLRANDFTLRPQLDARDVEQSYYASFISDEGECPPFFDYKFSKSIRSYSPSTPMIQDWRLSQPTGHHLSPIPRVSKKVSKEAAIMADLYAGLDKDDADVQDFLLGGKSSALVGEGTAYPSSNSSTTSEAADIYVPLVGVRKAMCVRILNSFLDNRNQTAFTIWCYDVESGMEWYAPVRYYNDFKDLRSALLRVDKTIADIPFPSLGWGLAFSIETGESAKSTKLKELRRSQLEIFLRQAFAHVYRGRLHPFIAEVAVHLQTFVGCDTVLDEGGGSGLSLSKQVAISESTYGKRMPDPKSERDINARRHLKRSVMRYVYRLFLLPAMERLITNFIDANREMVISDSSSSQQFSVSKREARASIEKIRDFIDKLQELILDGCHDDFVSMAQRRDFAALVDDSNNLVRDDLFREAVREQIELEVYVPLRSTISKNLVYAWFNEDMEMKHKMKALIDKPQSYFRISKDHRSRSDWKSVSRILKEGVGRSTLPCVKLRAVVDAAKEISQLDAEERSVFPDATFFDATVVTKVKALGADDFLPIFIYCFVQAKIERPSALCELLSILCDPAKMNGEVGYYLATFHAALTHIHELDLTEADNDLSIIFDTE